MSRREDFARAARDGVVKVVDIAPSAVVDPVQIPPEGFEYRNRLAPGRARANRLGEESKEALARRIFGKSAYAGDIGKLLEDIGADSWLVVEALRVAVRSSGVSYDLLRQNFPGSLVSLSEIVAYAVPGIDEVKSFMDYVDGLWRLDRMAEMRKIDPEKADSERIRLVRYGRKAHSRNKQLEE